MRQARANAADRTPENPSKYLKLLMKIKIGWGARTRTWE